MDNCSMMSTYSSLLVWRTLERRQGIEEPDVVVVLFWRERDCVGRVVSAGEDLCVFQY